MNEIIEKIRKYSVNLYLVKKVRKNVYNAVRFPNDIDQQIRDTYVSNIEHFVEPNILLQNFQQIKYQYGKI